MTEKFYYLVNPKEEYLLKYQYYYEKLSQSQISMDYLRNAKVYCFFSGPELIGGFVLANGANGNCLRYFSIFEDVSSQKALAKLKKMFEVDERKSLEISCLWMRKEVLLNRDLFYKILGDETIKEVKKNNYQFVFGGSIEPHAQRFQSMFLPRIFYQGIIPTKEIGVLKNQDGNLVMIYFIRTSELQDQVSKLNRHMFFSRIKERYNKGRKVMIGTDPIRNKVRKLVAMF